MEKLEFEGMNIINKDKNCIIHLEDQYGAINIRIRDRRTGSTIGFSTNSFQSFLDDIKKEYKVQVDEIDWIKFFKYNFSDVGRKIFDKIRGIPEKWQRIIKNKVIYSTAIKYGLESKQVKAMIKLYGDEE